jgi:hypothetical protein
MIKKTLIGILILFLNINSATAQKTDSHTLTPEQSMIVAKKLMSFYQQYENGAPESLKKAKFNEYINEVNPALSNDDRKKAYIIVNAYISASQDKKVDYILTDKQNDELENLLNQYNKKQKEGEQALNTKINEIKTMNYDEYKNYVTQNGEIMIPENEIIKSYNQLHQNKKKDTLIQQKRSLTPMKAIDILRQPQNYSFKEFKSAMNILKPEVSDDEIKNIWNKINK